MLCCFHVSRDTLYLLQSRSWCQTQDSCQRKLPIVGHVSLSAAVFTCCVSHTALDHVSLEPVNGRSMEEVPHMNHYCRGREWGVQGEHNSCYIDATLFGLFALSSEFDNLLASLSPREGPQGEIATNISSTLQAKIINPLRK